MVRRRNLAAAIAEPTYVWINDDAMTSSIGVRLGQGTLADCLQQGRTWNDYVRQVLEARARAIKELKAAKRKTIKPTAGAAVVVSDRR